FVTQSSPVTIHFFFFLSKYIITHRDLHSFPTRRSSDLQHGIVSSRSPSEIILQSIQDPFEIVIRQIQALPALPRFSREGGNTRSMTRIIRNQGTRIETS